jgi:hypothetical protein
MLISGLIDSPSSPYISRRRIRCASAWADALLLRLPGSKGRTRQSLDCPAAGQSPGRCRGGCCLAGWIPIPPRGRFWTAQGIGGEVVDGDPGWRVEGGEEWEMHGTERFSRHNLGNQPEIPLPGASTARTRTSLVCGFPATVPGHPVVAFPSPGASAIAPESRGGQEAEVVRKQGGSRPSWCISWTPPWNCDSAFSYDALAHLP